MVKGPSASTLSMEEGNQFRSDLAINLVNEESPTCLPYPIEPGALAPHTATQQTRPGGQIVWVTNGPPGTRVNIGLSRLPNSGGHLHSGGPTGTILPASFVLGSPYPQNVRSVYTAPEASGMIEQTCRFSTGAPVINYNHVGIPGLVQLSAAVGLVLTGASSTHPQNHYGLPILIQKIQQLGSKFHTKFLKDLFVNDMSLPEGGLYDFKNTWSPPHATHREGKTVDINSTSMSAEEQAFFRTAANALGFRVTL